MRDNTPFLRSYHISSYLVCNFLLIVYKFYYYSFQVQHLHGSNSGNISTAYETSTDGPGLIVTGSATMKSASAASSTKVFHNISCNVFRFYV